MASLRSCDLSANALAELPVEVGALRRLESLSLAHNAIRELPDEFGYMTGITSLGISHVRASARCRAPGPALTPPISPCRTSWRLCRRD